MSEIAIIFDPSLYAIKWMKVIKVYNSPVSNLPIMVIDDEEAILFSIDTLLRMSGFNNIITCSDSREVMDILSCQQVEIILLDLSMPHVPGERLLSMLTDKFPDITVVIITAIANKSSAVRCMQLGAFDYVTKPLEENRLINTVNRAVSFKRENCAFKSEFVGS